MGKIQLTNPVELCLTGLQANQMSKLIKGKNIPDRKILFFPQLHYTFELFWQFCCFHVYLNVHYLSTFEMFWASYLSNYSIGFWIMGHNNYKKENRSFKDVGRNRKGSFLQQSFYSCSWAYIRVNVNTFPLYNLQPEVRTATIYIEKSEILIYGPDCSIFLF